MKQQPSRILDVVTTAAANGLNDGLDEMQMTADTLRQRVEECNWLDASAEHGRRTQSQKAEKSTRTAGRGCEFQRGGQCQSLSWCFLDREPPTSAKHAKCKSWMMEFEKGLEYAQLLQTDSAVKAEWDGRTKTHHQNRRQARDTKRKRIRLKSARM
eukprot:gnl/TRDRNA2_/TRDRNA2_119575_c1_seq1.p1 gnl/TRDRNA2_/TRDRNA2_119575_c1~~gnl/TRDRNA2_/TRDRNA2_119575_c1_seq1.p1  ORF type:complete len:156 (+),score=32.76 gnl/TRDRNA2_/TRDRNA2_119575_c1_seq1:3-470(+)